MKNIIRLSFLVVVIGFSMVLNSCNQDVPFKFTYTLDPYAFTCPAMPFDGTEKVFGDTVITRDIEAELNQYGASLQNVTSMKLKAITLNITSTGATFDGIDYLTSYINSTGLPETKLAYKTSIPQTGLTSISMDNNYSELVDFIQADTFKVNVKGYNTVDFPNPTDMTVQVSFDISGMVPAK